MEPSSIQQSAETDNSVGTLLTTADIGMVGKLFQATATVLSQILKTTNDAGTLNVAHKKALVRILQSLILWGDSHDVTGGSLNAALQRSRNLLRVTLSPLRSMGQTLLRGTLNLLSCLGHRVTDSLIMRIQRHLATSTSPVTSVRDHPADGLGRYPRRF